ncbi:MAG: carboxymuconolactone decarboxylase family protein [Micromonosporaceae bacterium]|jgi:4-carboxymuconolactone decarboxylase
MSTEPETVDGADIRRAILGDAWVSSAQAGDGDALDHFARISIDHVWRAFWTRPGLELHLRSVATIAALAALEAHGELVAHVKGALRNKFLTPVQVRELLLHLTPYIGFPRSRHAIAAVNDVLRDAEAGEGGGEA